MKTYYPHAKKNHNNDKKFRLPREDETDSEGLLWGGDQSV
jgi:hypothetical protein